MTEEHIKYLDDLRDSGEINMLGASRYLQGYFELTSKEANEIVAEWRKYTCNLT